VLRTVRDQAAELSTPRRRADFGGDKFQPESYSQRLRKFLPAELRERSSVGGERRENRKSTLIIPALQNLPKTLSRIDQIADGYTRAAAPGKAALISLANGHRCDRQKSVRAS